MAKKKSSTTTKEFPILKLNNNQNHQNFFVILEVNLYFFK